jgi:hypothetical protein
VLGEEDRDQQVNYKFEYKEGYNVFKAECTELQNAVFFRFEVPLKNEKKPCAISKPA